MRFMVLVKADKTTESGAMPEEQGLAEMTKFNEELVAAGVMLAGEGLHPSSAGARVTFRAGQAEVIRGPFRDPPEQLIAGWWLWELGSLDEAIDWLKRSPFAAGIDAAVEIRRVFEAEDFGEAFTPELREAEERMREQLTGRSS
jgi:hypothetical protein